MSDYFYLTILKPNAVTNTFVQLLNMQQSFGHCIFSQTNIHQIKMVQRKAARFVFNDYSRHSSITDMLNQLNWQTFEKWRDDLTLLMLYNISM